MTVTESFEDPAFVVGAGRSGTTLLAAMLNRHPCLAVPGETHFFQRLDYQGGWEAIRRRGPDAVVTWLHDVCERAELSLEVEEWLHAAAPNRSSGADPRNLFLALGRMLTREAAKAGWIEKTPNNLLHWQEIRRWFPRARFIHIVRDGRDVALSQKRVPWGSRSFIENLAVWCDYVTAGDALAATAGVLCLRFEDLVASPVAELERVCAFLDVPFAESMLVPDGSEAGLMRQSESWKHQVLEGINPAQANRWRHLASRAQKASALAVAGAQLARHGYESPLPSPCAEPELRISRALLRDEPELWDGLVHQFALRGYAVRPVATVAGILAQPRLGIIILGTTRAVAADLSRAHRVPGAVWARLLGMMRAIASACRQGLYVVWALGTRENRGWRLHRLLSRVMTAVCDESVEPGNLPDIDAATLKVASRRVAHGSPGRCARYADWVKSIWQKTTLLRPRSRASQSADGPAASASARTPPSKRPPRQ